MSQVLRGYLLRCRGEAHHQGFLQQQPTKIGLGMCQESSEHVRSYMNWCNKMQQVEYRSTLAVSILKPFVIRSTVTGLAHEDEARGRQPWKRPSR